MKKNITRLSALIYISCMCSPIAHSVTHVSEDALQLPPIYIEKTSSLKRGQSLSTLLIKEGLPSQQVHLALSSLSKKYSLRKLPEGQRIAFLYKENTNTNTPESFEQLMFNTRDDKSIEVTRTDNTYATKVADRILISRKAVAQGEIRSSLFAATSAAGLPDALVIPYVELFAWDLDFTRDIRTGDKFEILYEKLYDTDDTLIRTGEILAARFVGKDGTYEAFRADNGEYYDRQGLSKERMLLRTPLKFSRISSHFNPNRKHPVLGYTRAHKGTDFAAPTGTPIKAAGTGRIEELGWKGGYGKYIRIRHNTIYKTAYAHLNGYAKGMHTGKRVRQGQVIGYVGTTGRSTGPHLHYEVHRHGKQVNAMTVKLPNGAPLEKKYKASFNEAVAEADHMWQTLVAEHTP